MGVEEVAVATGLGAQDGHKTPLPHSTIKRQYRGMERSIFKPNNVTDAARA